VSAPSLTPVRDRAITVVLAQLDHGHDTPETLAAAIVDDLIGAGIIPTPPPAVAVPVQVRPPSPTEETIARRTSRRSCRFPWKAAYNPDKPAEKAIIQRRTGPGMTLYRCGCGWSHLGHPDDTDRPAAPPLPEGNPIVWAMEKRNVVLVNGAGQVQARGIAESFCDAPTLCVRVGDRLVTWRADMTRTAPM
jgi:hypothetical protein